MLGWTLSNRWISWRIASELLRYGRLTGPWTPRWVISRLYPRTVEGEEEAAAAEGATSPLTKTKMAASSGKRRCSCLRNEIWQQKKKIAIEDRKKTTPTKIDHWWKYGARMRNPVTYYASAEQEFEEFPVMPDGGKPAARAAGILSGESELRWNRTGSPGFSAVCRLYTSRLLKL